MFRFHSHLFVSREAELIYILTELDGKNRTSKLQITTEHYENAELAEKWYRGLLDMLSDKQGPAAEKLEDLYRIMVGPL